jgi:tetratricopeptide (TPR) repeat protein
MDVPETGTFAAAPGDGLTVAEVVERLAQGPAPAEILDALERGAEALLSSDLVHRLVPYADQLHAVVYAGRPWAAMTAGVAICAIDRSRGRSVLSAGRAEFVARGDEFGEGWASFLEGLQDLGEGNLERAEQRWNRARDLLGTATPASQFSALHLSLAAYRNGDLGRAARIAERELGAARLRDDDRMISIAAVYLALFRWWTGEFAAVERAARCGEQALYRQPDPLDRYEEPVMHAALGTVSAMRGDFDAAEVHLAAGLAKAAELRNEWYDAIVRTIRAVLTSARDPLRGIADARHALDYYDRVGEDWWSHWALEAYVIAQREYGDLHASVAAGRILLEGVDNHLELGRARLELATTLIRLGETEEPLALLGQSIRDLERAGARYLTARAELQLANINPQRSAYLQRSARARAGADADDPGWKRLLRGAPVRIQVLGVPHAEVEGKAVSFGTRHELETLSALALAGADGISTERLCEMLWPGGSPRSNRHRLDVVLSSLRRHLLPATRLTRDNGVLHLDLDEGECDAATAVAQARRHLAGQSHDPAEAERACATLRSPLLGGAAEEWIVAAQHDLDSLQAQLETRLSFARRAESVDPLPAAANE